MNNEEKKYIKLTPFKMQVLQSFPFIDADFDALTNYELLCKVVDYLNKTIDNVDVLNDEVEEYINKFNELKAYVDNYFDNLDVQEEVNNKLDEMAESGELTDIIAEYLQLAGMLIFNNVNDMKQATNLANGSTCATMGYYQINDGGSATYKITDTPSLVDYQEELANGLYATLIINDYVTPEMFGAYGDSTHNDTIPLQKAILYNKNVILTKNYLINETIEIKDTENININAKKSNIIYTGNNSAILIKHLNGGNINFGTIQAENGNGIELNSINGTQDRIMYLKISFNKLTCGNKNIYVNIENTGYINEIDLLGGQITSGDYGLYFNNANTEVSGCNAWRIENIGFEGCDVCIYYNATNQGRYFGHIISNIRYVENTTSKILETHGKFYRCKLISYGNIIESRLNLDSPNLTDFELIAPIYNEELTSLIATGIYYNGIRKRYMNEREIKETLTSNSNVTSGFITLFKLNNLVIINLSEVVVTGTTTLNIIDNNPYPPSSFTGNFESIIMNATADAFGRVLVRTNGTIAVKVNDITKSFNGSIVYFTDLF